MTNKGIADFVAATMDAVLNSAEHKALFGSNYKFASGKCSKCGSESCSCGDSMHADDNDKKSKKDSSSDSSHADDNDKKSKKDSSGDSSHAGDSVTDPKTGATVSSGGSKIEFPVDSIKGDKSHADDNDAKKKKDSSKDSSGDSSKADDNDAKKHKDSSSSSSSDSSKADDDDDMKAQAAFAVALDSLLTASAALDAVGMEKTAEVSLRLASLVAEAKKKDKDSKKSKKDSKDSKKDSKKSDSNSAKDKKSDSKKDSKKSDSKKDDKKSSKK